MINKHSTIDAKSKILNSPLVLNFIQYKFKKCNKPMAKRILSLILNFRQQITLDDLTTTKFFYQYNMGKFEGSVMKPLYYISLKRELNGFLLEQDLDTIDYGEKYNAKGLL